MRQVEDFIEAVQRCDSGAELDDLFLSAMAAEGFENICFARAQAGRVIDIPWRHFPDGLLETYMAERLFEADPILARVVHSNGPVIWHDVEKSPTLSRRERLTLGTIKELGAHSGVTIPFIGPDGVCDLLSCSQRERERPDWSRLPLLQVMAYIARSRYWHLKYSQSARKPSVACDHSGGPDGMSSRHCRALVLIDVAARRRAMGLVDLSERVCAYVAQYDLEDLLGWGFLEKCGDKSAAELSVTASVLGTMHLKTCPQSARFRREVWEVDVRRGEIPAL